MEAVKNHKNIKIAQNVVWVNTHFVIKIEHTVCNDHKSIAYLSMAKGWVKSLKSA